MEITENNLKYQINFLNSFIDTLEKEFFLFDSESQKKLYKLLKSFNFEYARIFLYNFHNIYENDKK